MLASGPVTVKPAAGPGRASVARVPSPTQLRGARAEDLVEGELLRAGYRILTRNWRGGGGELDLVAWDGEVLGFVEVRSRRTAAFGLPSETVDRRKQRKVVRAAEAFLAAHFPAGGVMARFDVVSVVDPGDGAAPEVVLIRDAFDAGR
jgi:putative endonuclease